MPKPIFAQSIKTGITPGTYALLLASLFVIQNGHVHVVDTAVNADIGGFTTVGNEPNGAIAMSADGTRAYVSSGASDSNVSVYDLTVWPFVLLKSVTIAGANIADIVISQDQQYVLISDNALNKVYFYTRSNMVFSFTVNTHGTQPWGLTTYSRGGVAYFAVCCHAGATPQMETWIINGAFQNAFLTANSPFYVKVSADGKTGYVSGQSGSVVPCNLVTGAMGAAIPTIGSAVGMALTLDGKTLYVAINSGNGAVQIIDIPSLTVTGTIVIPNNPTGFSSPVPWQPILSADGTKLYIGGTGGIYITVVTLATGAITFILMIGDGVQPIGPAFLAYGNVTIAPVGAAQVIQVPSDQKWNVIVTLSGVTDGIGYYTVVSGQRIISTAVVGSSIGPFTAYYGEIIAVSATQIPNGYTVTVTGHAYERGEECPTLFPTAPSIQGH